MSWSWTLYRYLAIQFLIGVSVVYALFLVMAFSIDIVDLLNRTAGHNVPGATAVGMALLQLPNLGQKMLPFAILLGGVFTFVRLARSRERSRASWWRWWGPTPRGSPRCFALSPASSSRAAEP